MKELEGDIEEYYELAKKITKGSPLYRDLFHEVYLQIQEKEFKESDNVKGYIAVAMWRQFYGDSKFRKLYSDTGEELPEIRQEHDLERWGAIEKVSLVQQRLPEFERMISELVLSGWKMTEIAESTQVPIDTIRKAWQCFKKEVKRNLNVCR